MKLHEAVIFAAEAHQGQTRKSGEAPYFTHPYTAALYAMPYISSTNFSDGEKNNILIAVLLHDVWEDTDITLGEIENQFGESAAHLVRGASEPDKTKTWIERKRETITKAAEASISQKYVICADKLHNLISITEAVRLQGEKAWNVFKQGRDMQEWYYRSLYEALVKDLDPVPPFFLELHKQIDSVF